MMKKFLQILFISVALLNAQEKHTIIKDAAQQADKPGEIQKYIGGELNSGGGSTVESSVLQSPTDGIIIGSTDYDYGWNSGFRRMISTGNYGAVAHMTFMERNLNAVSPNNNRAQKYVYYNGSNLVTSYPQPKASGASGFGAVDAFQSGIRNNRAVMVYHTPISFAIDQGAGLGNFTVTSISASFPEALQDPSITIDNKTQTLWLLETKNRKDYSIYKSTNYGTSWIFVDSLLKYVKNQGLKIGALDVPVLVAPNGNLAVVTGLIGSGNIPPTGSANASTADQFGYFLSTNGGTSWTWNALGIDGTAIQIGDSTMYFSLMSVTQFSAVFDNNSELKVVMNGYCTSLDIQNNYFTTLYRSSNPNSTWKIISRLSDAHYDQYNYYKSSTNAFGFPYPTIAIDSAAKTLFSSWSQPRIISGRIDTAYNGYPKQDLWYATSTNGGTSWSTSQKLANTEGAIFVNAAPQLTRGTNSALRIAHFLYLEDTTAGTAVFSNSNSTTINWIYRQIEFSAEIIPPTITFINPNNGIIGSTVVIAGTNFGTTQGTSEVRFGTVQASVTNWSNTSISVTVPAGISGTVSVSVIVNNQTATATSQFTVLSSPSSPTVFVASPVSTSQVNLQWTASASGSPTVYRIYRSSASSSGFTKIDSVSSSLTTFSNIGLSANTVYWYRVTGVNANGESSPSNEDSAKTFGNATASISLSAASLSFGSITPGSSSERILTITNTGNTTLSCNASVPANAGYAINKTSFNITAGGKDSLIITFSPTAAQAYNSTLTLTHNAAGSPSIVALSGTGQSSSGGPSLSLDKLGVLVVSNSNFTNAIVADILITNNGSTALDMTISYSGGIDLNITGSGQTILTPGSVKPIIVRVSSLTLAAGTYTGTITITHNAAGSPTTIPVEVRRVNIPATIDVTKSITFSDASAATSYKLISIPGTSSVKPPSVFAGEYKKDWRMFLDNGAATNYFTEYDGSAQFDFSPGKGFWALTKKTFSSTGVVANYTTSGYYTLPLRNGWNIIATPFERSTTWNDIKYLNLLAPNATISSWNNGWSTAGSLIPYQAYYYNNVGNLPSIVIPYNPNGSLGKNDVSFNETPPVSEQHLEISLKDGQRNYSTVYAAFDESAGDNYDQTDFFAPPSTFALSNIQIENAKFTTVTKRLFIEHRRKIGEGQSFHLIVKNTVHAEFEFRGLEHFSNEEVLLVDEQRGTAFDLRSHQHLAVPISNEDQHFTLMIGSAAYTSEAKKKLMPADFILYQNYPNPFNPSTVISYQLPVTGHVILTVYDAIGREAVILENGLKEAGYYTVSFTAKNLASGIYFARLSSEGKTQIRKLLLMK